jgi:hypothetical protein
MYIPLTFEGALQNCLIASSSYQGTFISGGIQYGYHAITGSSTFEVYNGSLQAQIIVVGGGGGGGSSNRASGGGGGGQVKYLPAQQLYKGTYTIQIGQGGIGGTPTVPATQGGTTSIIGPGFSLSSIGGYPSLGTTGGNSGDGFTGGTGCTNVSGNGGAGGGGGGSTAAAANVNCAQPTIATDGGAGLDISFGNYDWSFGCGGGGGSSSGDGGRSCFGGDGFGNPGTAGGPNTGNGGGGSWISGLSCTGGNGGSGVVIIQYRINDYCKNFFNETGSCGCREITFDITDPLNYYPDITGNYVYTPCGTNDLISGSIEAYYPKTVCASSGSYYWVKGDGAYGNSLGIASSGPECFSANYGVQTCVTQSFVPTCESKVYSFYATGSSATQTIHYVPKNSGSVVYESLANRNVIYKCISSGSFNQLGSGMQPYGITGNGNAVTASCTQISVVRISGAPYIFKWVDCGGTYMTQSITTTYDFSKCVDMSQPYDFNGVGGGITIGGNCLTGSLLPPCGCP